MEAARADQVLIGLAQCAWSSIVRGATSAVLPLFFHPLSWCGRISLSKPLRASKPAMTSKASGHKLSTRQPTGSRSGSCLRVKQTRHSLSEWQRVMSSPTDLAFHEMHGVKVHSRVCVALDSFRPWNFYAVDKCCWLASLLALGCFCWHGSLWWYTTTTVTGESKSKRVSHSFQRTYTRHTSKPRAVELFSKIAIKLTRIFLSNNRIVALAGCSTGWMWSSVGKI